jgi:hypothetical protein
MWDLHHCKRAVGRVQEMVPRMPEDFQHAPFRRLLSNALLWVLEKPIPAP